MCELLIDSGRSESGAVKPPDGGGRCGRSPLDEPARALLQASSDVSGQTHRRPHLAIRQPLPSLVVRREILVRAGQASLAEERLPPGACRLTRRRMGLLGLGQLEQARAAAAAAWTGLKAPSKVPSMLRHGPCAHRAFIGRKAPAGEAILRKPCIAAARPAPAFSVDGPSSAAGKHAEDHGGNQVIHGRFRRRRRILAAALSDAAASGPPAPQGRRKSSGTGSHLHDCKTGEAHRRCLRCARPIIRRDRRRRRYGSTDRTRTLPARSRRVFDFPWKDDFGRQYTGIESPGGGRLDPGAGRR